MTHQSDHTPQALEEVIHHGLDGLQSVLSLLFNEAMKVERSRAIGSITYLVLDVR